MTYRFLVVLWLLTLANIYDSKSSYNSPAYSLAVYGLVNTFYLIGLVRLKKGCNKVWCSPFKMKQKKTRGAPAIGNNPMVNPSQVLLLWYSVLGSLRERKGRWSGGRVLCRTTPDQSVRGDLNMTAYLPPAGRQGGVFLKGSEKGEGFFCFFATTNIHSPWVKVGG